MQPIDLQDELNRAVKLKIALEEEINMYWEKSKALLRQLFREELRVQRLAEKVTLMRESEKEQEECEDVNN